MADFLNINEILSHLDIQESMSACEFGCGSADFTIALSKKMNKGRVYALDIQEEKISALKGKIALRGLSNVSTILCDLEAQNGSTLRDNSQDVVLIPNTLFQAENKNAMMTEARRLLKSGGQLLIIDWLKGGPFSPKSGLVSPDEAKKMAQSLGFSFKKEFASGDYHYALVFTK